LGSIVFTTTFDFALKSNKSTFAIVFILVVNPTLKGLLVVIHASLRSIVSTTIIPSSRSMHSIVYDVVRCNIVVQDQDIMKKRVFCN
jgi:hypothetical protein